MSKYRKLTPEEEASRQREDRATLLHIIAQMKRQGCDQEEIAKQSALLCRHIAVGNHRIRIADIFPVEVVGIRFNYVTSAAIDKRILFKSRN